MKYKLVKLIEDAVVYSPRLRKEIVLDKGCVFMILTKPYHQRIIMVVTRISKKCYFLDPKKLRYLNNRKLGYVSSP